MAHTTFFTYVFLKISDKAVFAVLLHTSLNYFIFLRNNLFPSLSETVLDTNVYVGVASLVALVAAFGIMRQTKTSFS